MLHFIKQRTSHFLNPHPLMLWISLMSAISAQPFHTPTSNFTLSTLQTRLNKTIFFISQSDPMKVPYGLTIYILLTSYLKGELNKVSLKYIQGERYYGDAWCFPVLGGTQAGSIVERDNSCLYIWQTNRLIKGVHVCFCAWYLALSKHCHISSAQPSQTQHLFSS